MLEPEVAAELRELEARAALKTHLQVVIAEIERQKQLAAYKLCLNDGVLPKVLLTARSLE